MLQKAFQHSSLISIFAFALALNACGSSEKKDKAPAPAAETQEAPATEATTAAPATPTEAAPPTPPPPPAVTAAPLPEAPALSWGYLGDKGPSNWGKLDPLYSMCDTGKKQSPIDLKWKKPSAGSDVKVNYKETTLRLTDVGHTIQVNVDPGSFVTVNGKDYELMHFQFRTSSEHTLSGNELPLEVQFFHRNKDGKLVVLSSIVIEGATSDLIDRLWNNLPTQKMQEVSQPRFVYNPTELLPAKHTHYHYEGSLTTPPCTEGVEWFVFNTPLTASADQILAFRKVYSKNKRPTQALNARKVTIH